ncbi:MULTISPECIES: AAA family ATPase [unclassified Granulicatella]|uniref:AAA family ATPase n=1 Tax=unclassified Granulicatella TaxID=2630493 RepID=UPI0010738557|nr:MULTISPECIES: AAA family ATPase [unclassified Granulicatella]MBF0779665.1 AAA family ATPase [Granulicatella sp. 19428wC4_WM01]TFU96320.1 AAA family ATPase [Granulicatella sp. WM01]
MTFSIKSALRFLFPEIQIIDTIKQEGFIVKEKQQSVTMPFTNNSTLGHTIVQNKTNAYSPSSENQAKSSKSDKVEFSMNSRTDKSDNNFDGIEQLLRQSWVASESNISALCQAFKRPFVMGTDDSMPRNTILIIGHDSHGKVKAVKDMCLLLNERGILDYVDVPKVVFDRYPTGAEEDVFMSDLYKGLYSQSDVVVFEHVDKANFRYLEVVMQLVKNGNYQLTKRYSLQNNVLVDSTGMLNTTSISEFNTNGKYFIFTATGSFDKVTEYIGSEFTQEINDIIVLDAFSELELREIIMNLLTNVNEKVERQLRINLQLDNSCVDAIMRFYDTRKGVKGLVEHIDDNIYKPLSEYVMQHEVTKRDEVVLKYEEDYMLYVNNVSVLLDNYERHYNRLTLDSIKEELNSIVGLKTVKEYVFNLENNLSVQQLRAAKGLKSASLSMHMIFTGNPGTGKTTIARIVAKYLKAIGVLSSGQLREVSRADMVGQYVGQTAKLTMDLIKSAVGGVLFIDEAYALCRDKHDVFGLEAIDALVKGMEDYRDDLVVILAGYSREMADFLKINSGLQSRFPHIIEFEDYTPQEMYDIANIIAKSKGYRISEECHAAMVDLFERKQIKGKNDSGNGRLVRNVVESAILSQSQRIAKDTTQDLELLTVADFDLLEKEAFNLEEKLSTIIGLDNVKEFIRAQYHVIRAREKRQKASLTVDTTQSLNMIFSGNPGTGKTTMARVVADMFHAMGVLKSGHLVEVDKKDLISEYVGQTATKTQEVFKSALGGVLFIDEAYAITNDGSLFGQECIDVLVKLIEDYRGEIVVILAGYEKEMNDFMKVNSGLDSRFPLKIEFPDYSADELFEIGKQMMNKKGFVFSDDAILSFKEAIYHLKRHATVTSGNARMVRNFLDEVIRNQSTRIAMSDVSDEELSVITLLDIEPEIPSGKNYDLEAELSKVVGLDAVKQYIRSLNARLIVQEERKKNGLKVDDTQTLHMIFTGNSGTGKTMIARTIANVLANMGIIPTNKLVETDRSGLVAGYVGQTAIKTREVIESAFNGVLFIDEAYALAQGGTNDFGQEAIDTLVKMMDDNRDKLVVILAGYTDDMQNFLQQNAGLRSRFPHIIQFDDYSTDELFSIAEKMYTNQGYILSQEATVLLKQVLEQARRQAQFGNGRYVRNIFERSLNAQAVRLSRSGTMGADELPLITVDDIKEVLG